MDHMKRDESRYCAVCGRESTFRFDPTIVTPQFYFIVDVSEGLVRSADILAENHALRGADAIPLASAVL